MYKSIRHQLITQMPYEALHILLENTDMGTLDKFVETVEYKVLSYPQLYTFKGDFRSLLVWMNAPFYNGINWQRYMKVKCETRNYDFDKWWKHRIVVTNKTIKQNGKRKK